MVKDSTWSPTVKTVSLELNGVSLARPMMRLNSRDRLVLRFDVLESEPQNFRYRLHHCDRQWRVDDAAPFDFINGFEEEAIVNYQHSFTTQQEYVNYNQSLPPENSDLILSGNYVVEVFLEEQPDSVILTRRFCVFEDIVDIQLSVDKPLHASGDVWRDQEVNVSVAMRPDIFIANPTSSLTVTVQQNQRTDAVHTLPFSGYEGQTLMYRWQQANLFPGGNCFRFFDSSNLHASMYNIARIENYGGETFAILSPLENRSRKPYVYEQTLNGGMKVNVWDRQSPATEADYVEVNFTLPMDYPLMNGGVYIIGDLTDWLFNDASRMEWKPEYNAYFKRLLLKQGYYAYQLLVWFKGEPCASTAILEGDHFEMPNDYTVRVYLRQISDRFDRLAGVRTRQ